MYSYQKEFRILFWLALFTSYIFALLPNTLAPHVPQVSDKVHHIFAFIVLGILLRFSYRISYWYALFILFGYGVIIELSQYFLPTRSADYQDVMADLIGSFIGLKLYKYVRKVI